MTREQVTERLQSAFPQCPIEVVDLTGGGDHYQVLVISPAFKGKTRIEQHQMVMAAFSAELKTGEVHALSIQTKIM